MGVNSGRTGYCGWGRLESMSGENTRILLTKKNIKLSSFGVETS